MIVIGIKNLSYFTGKTQTEKQNEITEQSKKEKITLEEAKKYDKFFSDDGELIWNFEPSNSSPSGYDRVFYDNRKSIYHQPYIAPVTNIDEIKICKQIGEGVEKRLVRLVNFRIFSRNNIPDKFDVSFEYGDTEVCCIEGTIDWKNKKVIFSKTIGYGRMF